MVSEQSCYANIKHPPSQKEIATHDPDSDITLWELTAFNGYLVDKYDAE
jgi:hypothetical protein